MKQIFAFLIFFAFSAAETQTIWKDIFEVFVVCDLEENTEESEKKIEFEEDKIFHVNTSNQFLYFPKVNQNQNCLIISNFYNSTFFPVNTPPPEV